MIEYHSQARAFLCVTYDEFDDLRKLSDATWAYHVNQICRRMLLGVLIALEDDPGRVERPTDHQKQLLKFQIQRFLGSLSAAEHERAVRALKNFGDKARDFFHKYGGPINVVIAALMSKLGLDHVDLPSDLPEETKLDESLRYHYGHLLQIARLSLPSSCETASAVGLLSLRARTDVLSCRSSLQGWIPSRGWMPPVEERREP
jgi:hypothetical protein